MPKQNLSEHIIPIKKLFIANRGEIAVRAALACEKRKIPAVIPYSFSDPYSLATRMADKNGKKGWELAVLSGTTAQETYMNPDAVLEAIQLHACDAVFLGYGFLAENAYFARQCEKAGVRVLGPKAAVIEAVGNKISAREIAKKIKIAPFTPIPVLEGSKNLQFFEEAAKQAKELGYPVMLKDPDTGGGVGNIVANNETELQQAYTSLKMNPNNTTLFLERYIKRAVHVEIQIAADMHGNVVSLGERDCTMQRRSQKVIEESPSPHISEQTRALLQNAAVAFAKKVEYTGVGTWEFIVDRDKDEAWYFMEVNPRIQVEHGVTEEQTGIDIVSTMIDIAEGRKLSFSQADIHYTGHTIEARIYGENPEDNFKADSGLLKELVYPELPGLRIDKGAEEGDEISPWFDTTICKLLAHGETREEATNLLATALTELKISGLHTNKDFLLQLLHTKTFKDAEGTTTFIQQWWQKQLKSKIYELGGIIKGGSLREYAASREFKMTLLPQVIAVPSRKSDELTSYSDYYDVQKQKTGKDSAAEFGIVERNGIQFVIYELDDRFAAGTLGIAEGAAFEDACKLAYTLHLPLVTISRSGGARQQENTLALYQMGLTIHALNKYPPLFHINIYSGGVYGGVPASYAGAADVQIAVDAEETKIGFTGPYITAKVMGKQPKSFRAEDAYKELPEGTHKPRHLFQMRNIDILSPSLEDASDKITHLLHILNVPETITDPHMVFAPEEHFRLHLPKVSQIFTIPILREVLWVGKKIGRVLLNRPAVPEKDSSFTEYPRLPIVERRKVLSDPDRPTAADLIDTHSGIFSDVVTLSSVLQQDNTEQLQPVIAAVVQLDGPVLVLAHQTQWGIDPHTGKKTKVYISQKPADWEYSERMLEFAKKLELPVILFGDTIGADCLTESQDRNQAHKIAHLLKVLDAYPYPVLSINIGLKGSGGGETFIRSFDAAADFENALSFVSDPTTQYWILTGRWIDDESPKEKQEELSTYVEQLKDATAESRLESHQIDAIILEGEGGAHKKPEIAAHGLKDWLQKELAVLRKYSTEDLLERRSERIERVLQGVTTKRE